MKPILLGFPFQQPDKRLCFLIPDGIVHTILYHGSIHPAQFFQHLQFIQRVSLDQRLRRRPDTEPQIVSKVPVLFIRIAVRLKKPDSASSKRTGACLEDINF